MYVGSNPAFVSPTQSFGQNGGSPQNSISFASDDDSLRLSSDPIAAKPNAGFDPIGMCAMVGCCCVATVGGLLVGGGLLAKKAIDFVGSKLNNNKEQV